MIEHMAYFSLYLQKYNAWNQVDAAYLLLLIELPQTKLGLMLVKQE